MEKSRSGGKKEKTPKKKVRGCVDRGKYKVKLGSFFLKVLCILMESMLCACNNMNNAIERCKAQQEAVAFECTRKVFFEACKGACLLFAQQQSDKSGR